MKKRLEELSDAAKGLAFTNDLEKSSEERLNMVYEILKVPFYYLIFIWISLNVLMLV